MKRNIFSQIGSLVLLFVIASLFPSELGIIIGGAVFTILAIGMPLRFLAPVGAVAVIIYGFTFYDFKLGMYMALSFVLSGWAQGTLIRSRKGLGSILTAGTLIRGTFLLAAYSRLSDIEKINIKDLLKGEPPAEMYEVMAELGYGEEMSGAFAEMWDFFGNLIPAVIIVSALTYAFLSVGFAKFFLRKMPVAFAGIKKYSDIKPDIQFTICALLIMVFAFFKGDFEVILLNSAYVLYVIYMAFGFAFIMRLINKGVRKTAVSFFLTLIIAIVTFGFVLPFVGIVSAFVPEHNEEKESFNETSEDINENNEDEIRKDD